MPPAELFNRPVKPRANIAALFENSDYPVDAIRDAEEGTVGFIVKINELGRVADCLVEYSSGSSSLDVQTCRLMWLRARFVPARNQAGKPVTGAVRARIRWVLPDPDPLPITPWSSRVSLTLAKGGAVMSCKVQSTGALKVDQGDCGFFSYLPSQLLAPLMASANADVSTVFMETQFIPDESRDRIASDSKTDLIMRQVLRITIDPTGKISRCTTEESRGPIANIPEGCEEVEGSIFQMPKTQGGLPTSLDAKITRELRRRR